VLANEVVATVAQTDRARLRYRSRLSVWLLADARAAPCKENPMSYAMIEKDGITQSVTKEQFSALIARMSHRELIATVMSLADQVGVLRGAAEGLGKLN